MTTIATDGKSMACDGQADIDEVVVAHNRVKIKRLKDGSLLGLAGRAVDRDQLAEWIENGGTKPKLKDTMALHLLPNGRVDYYNEDCIATEHEVPSAVGSGMAYALGAMDAGADTKQAVEIAAKRDPFTGGKITVLRRNG